MNRESFSTGEHYHIYNRGTDKRNIFNDTNDVSRFLKSMELFNALEPIGSLYALTFERNEKAKKNLKQLVEIIAYCLNPNHYHFILRQKVNRGISEFMRRLNGGYTWYFNFKAKRTGYLFQGPFKGKHIPNNDYLLRVSAYVNLNDKAHQLSGAAAKLVQSSWEEYTKGIKYLCKTDLILKQFSNRKRYEKFALEALPQMLQRKKDEKELASLMLE